MQDKGTGLAGNERGFIIPDRFLLQLARDMGMTMEHMLDIMSIEELYMHYIDYQLQSEESKRAQGDLNKIGIK